MCVCLRVCVCVPVRLCVIVLVRACVCCFLCDGIGLIVVRARGWLVGVGVSRCVCGWCVVCASGRAWVCGCAMCVWCVCSLAVIMVA